MIIGQIKDLMRYLGCHHNLNAVISFLSDVDLSKMADGSYPGDDQHFHMNIFHTQLSENPNWEVHRRYIDLQIVLEGRETIAWLPMDSLGSLSPYDEEKDIQTSPDPQPGAPCTLEAGMFAIYFPEDAHRPGNGQGEIRKAVLKVRADIIHKEHPDTSSLHHLGTVCLKTPRLILRPYALEDAQAMFNNWAGDPEVTKTLLWDTHPDVEHTRRLLAGWVRAYQSGRHYHWVIEKDGEIIGDISLVKWSAIDLDGEIGYCLSQKAWNQGIMTEALREVLRFLFQRVGFHRLYLRHATENPASGRVMEKAGLKKEGLMHQAMRRKGGGFSDIALYAALRDEWLSEQGCL
ncbi:MAG: YhcH/YjgK/YiaL family protein [Christensenellales bacterium]|jgi:ribosomal-protein-alanine N-acetyltransferase